MEFFVVIVAGFVLAIPVIAIVALVRTGRLRESLDERFAGQMDKIRDLEAQVFRGTCKNSRRVGARGWFAAGGPWLGAAARRFARRIVVSGHGRAHFSGPRLAIVGFIETEFAR